MKADYLEKNKEGWNLRTGVHVGSDFYNLEDFLKGKSTLHKPELDLLGNVAGQELLHLQCHFGMDTMSWARLGAKCTGLDISSEAITKARELNKLLSLDVNFIEDDVHNLANHFDNQFDTIITSYGVLCWLYDINIWAKSIAKSLKKGGRFVLVEFHPVLDIIFNGKVSGHSSYFSEGAPLAEWTQGTYTNPDSDIRYFEYRWQNNMGSVINALIDAGLSIKAMQEYPYSPYRLFEGMDVQEDGLWHSSQNSYPYLYSLIAEK